MTREATTSFRPDATVVLTLGERTYDLRTRALVMGILNRTRDSFYSPAATFELDRFFARAERLVDEGADILDVGGVKAGPGEDVSEEEELDRVVGVVGALKKRFDLPLSIDTWRASVAGACFAQGAVLGNDISGFADPDYLAVAARAGAAVVATSGVTVAEGSVTERLKGPPAAPVVCLRTVRVGLDGGSGRESV